MTGWMPNAARTMIDADIRVEDARWTEGRDIGVLIEECLDAAMAEAGAMPEHAEIDILLTDDAAQRVLNRDHRGKDAPTNVLSFPAGEAPLPPGLACPLGDISLAFETVAREATSGGITIEAHLCHLIIHGFLHLLGYDHEDDAEASVMEATETRALMRLGIADPYRPEQV